MVTVEIMSDVAIAVSAARPIAAEHLRSGFAPIRLLGAALVVLSFRSPHDSSNLLRGSARCNERFDHARELHGEYPVDVR
jgi:hypothetical protein